MYLLYAGFLSSANIGLVVGYREILDRQRSCKRGTVLYVSRKANCVAQTLVRMAFGVPKDYF